VIGEGSVFPRCPQHQVANLAGSLTGGRDVLVGAVVNGPNGAENFEDLGIPDGARACPVDGRKANWPSGVACDVPDSAAQLSRVKVTQQRPGCGSSTARTVGGSPSTWSVRAWSMAWLAPQTS
jgi:hypothetical protein